MLQRRARRCSFSDGKRQAVDQVLLPVTAVALLIARVPEFDSIV